MRRRVLPLDELDFELCATSGQVFRFERFDRDGVQVWRGADGSNVIEVERTPDGWVACSRPDPSAVERFLRLDVSLSDVSRRVVQLDPSFAGFPACARCAKRELMRRCFHFSAR
ncbi:MAG: hypothetical protein C4342_04365 [Armatimonadota bacterium]